MKTKPHLTREATKTKRMRWLEIWQLKRERNALQRELFRADATIKTLTASNKYLAELLQKVHEIPNTLSLEDRIKIQRELEQEDV